MPQPGRLRRLYAVGVVLLMGAAVGWQLARDSGSDDAAEPDRPAATRGAGRSSPVAHQRTVVRFVGPDAIRVEEHLTYLGATDVVTLEAPEHRGAAAGFAPTIRELWVDTGDGRRTVPAPDDGGPVEVRLPEDAREVTVGYLASGVVRETPGPVPGRALALVSPLRGAEQGVRAVEVRGDWVDNLGCLDEAAGLTACGERVPGGWVTGAGDTGLVDVVAQLTLPVRSPRSTAPGR